MNARMTSVTMFMTLGPTMDPTERVSMWCARSKCATSCARRMASSDVCSSEGTSLVAGFAPKKPPSSVDHHESSSPCGSTATLSNGYFFMMSSRKPENTTMPFTYNPSRNH